MGWSGPGRQRHRRHACVWGTHAAAGHRCRGGLKAHAPSFGRPGFATGSSGSSDAAAHACGAGGTVRRRTRASPTIAKSFAIDQLNVAMDSIRFPTTCRHPRYAVTERGATVWAIREILTGGAVQTRVGGAGGAGMQLRSRPSRTRVAIHPVTQIGVRRSVHGCEPLRTDHEPSSDRNGATGQNADRTGGERNAKDVDAARTHSVARGGVAGKRGNAARRGNWSAHRSGIRPRLVKPESVRRSGRRWRPGRPPGRISRRKPTPSTRRCAVRAPCRAGGDQSQSRW